MGRREWEEGTFTLPAAEWAPLKTRMKAAHEQLREATLAVALHVHVAMNGPRYRGKRGVRFFGNAGEVDDLCTEAMAELAARAGLPGGLDPAALKSVDDWRVQQLLVPDLLNWRQSSAERETLMCRRPNKPTRKQLDAVIPPLGRGASAFEGTGFSIQFDDAKRQVVWTVEESKNACECSRAHWLAQALFDQLDGVTWTRGTGGEVVGNDEYNEDARDAGGGANYVKATYRTPSKSAEPQTLDGRRYGF